MARYGFIEKLLSKELLAKTKVGKTFIYNKNGVPIMKLNHLHFEPTEVKAHTRSAYDSISVDRL